MGGRSSLLLPAQTQLRPQSQSKNRNKPSAPNIPFLPLHKSQVLYRYKTFFFLREAHLIFHEYLISGCEGDTCIMSLSVKQRVTKNLVTKHTICINRGITWWFLLLIYLVLVLRVLSSWGRGSGLRFLPRCGIIWLKEKKQIQLKRGHLKKVFCWEVIGTPHRIKYRR